MAGKFALLLGNDQYQDEQFGSLMVPGNDVKALKTILENPAVGGFDRVDILLNASLEDIMAAMGDLFVNKNKDDLVLLYFSGHGALDRAGQLYLAVNQTQFKKLSSTAVWASFIKNEMNNSRSRRQVLILDCCHSGAFGRDSSGTKSAVGTEVINEATFDVKGYGREILVSSSATQLSWEGNKVIDKTDKSLFTHYLVEGLNSGKAAVKGNQEITVGQLYDYAYAKVVNAAANMTPQRWVDKLEGSIIIAKNPHPQIKAKSLPEKLLAALEDDQPFIREGAVRELGRLMKGKDQGQADTARQKLKAMQAEERDRYVWQVINELLNINKGKTTVQINKDTAQSETLAQKSTNDLTNLSENKPDTDNSIDKKKSSVNIPVVGLIAGKKRKTKFTVFTILVILVIVIYFLFEQKTEYPYLSDSDRYSDSTSILQKNNLGNKTSSTIKPGKVFQDTLKDGSKGPEMVVIPKGEFYMGDIQGNGNEDEKPVHKVNIKHPFALSKYPVTFEDYAVFVKDKGKKQPDDEGWGGDNRPVINVSWDDATAYTQWLSDQTGKVYRLPSEAEWEYAARAGTETAYWWGNQNGVNIANFQSSGSEWSGKKTSPVDAFKANPFGLHDMLGNVWEWIQDTWHEDYQGAPEDGSVWKGGDTSLRVLRGGSWNHLPAYVRLVLRNRITPHARYNTVGFRLAQDL